MRRILQTPGLAAGFAWGSVFLLAAAACDSPTSPDAPVVAAIDIVTGSGQSALVGTELTLPLVAKVLDANGRAVPGQRVSFTVVAGGGSVTPSSVLSDEQGVVQARWTLGTSVAESQRVEARVASGSANSAIAVTFDAIALTGPAAALRKVAGDGQTVEEGRSPADSLAVRVVDRFENPVRNVTVEWSVLTGGGTLSPATATTDAHGVAKTKWVLPRAGQNTARATVAGSPAVTFEVTATAVVGVPLISTSAGYLYSCGVTASGVAYCWGRMGGAPTGGLTFASVSAGVGHTCGVTTDHRAYCWGGDYGWTPVLVDAGREFVETTVGMRHTCALTASGAAYCWGDNSLGALGTGDQVYRAVPTPVAGGLTFKSLSAGWSYTCGVTSAGAGYCWGEGTALGNPASTVCGSDDSGGITCATRPVPVAGGLSFSQIRTGERFTCGLTTGGAAYCWGGPQGPQSNTPTAVPGGHNFTSLDVDAGRSCGVAVGGRVFCWGWIPVQDLSSDYPVPVAGDVTFATVSVGWFHSCGVAISGVAYCWGRNDNGELGDGTYLASPSPVKVVARP